MSSDRDVELADLVHHPGIYYSPQTEVVVVVDDSTEIDNEIISSAGFEDSEWILISEETPIDERQRDELIEEFQSTFSESRSSALDDGDDVEETDDDDDHGFKETDEEEDDSSYQSEDDDEEF